ncbi:hypothetical protein [Nostoc sp.]|uniref:hypothetical protein n=1 Tax=Nostoc sp. TaxID=1180 RepID=UPI002FFB8935
MVDKLSSGFTEVNPELMLRNFRQVELAFAWTRDRNAPLILGHMNFFLAFDVCFYRSELAF